MDIGEVSKLTLKPGEILVIKTHGELTEHYATMLKEKVRKALERPDLAVIVHDDLSEVSALNVDEATVRQLADSLERFYAKRGRVLAPRRTLDVT